MSDVRFALCHQVRSLNRSVAGAARDFGVSRNTAYKWLARFDRAGGGADAVTVGGVTSAVMKDRSRRPLCSPAKVGGAVEAAILAVRDAYGGWQGQVLLSLGLWSLARIRILILGTQQNVYVRNIA